MRNTDYEIRMLKNANEELKERLQDIEKRLGQVEFGVTCHTKQIQRLQAGGDD